ncbi:methyltransferase domain-containing protein [Staphylococcus chromogenes]|nr:methyltransferase domain-containing protein [Staphylococcus chromogenes]
MPKLMNTRRLATFRRALGLLRSFPLEQRDPARFYSGLARDTADQLEALAADCGLKSLSGLRILDVGGGPGYFATEFARRGATYFSLEPSEAELAAAGLAHPLAIRGDGRALPFPDNSFDLVFSSNVVEHISSPWRMGADMLRVVKPSGLAVVSYTIWLGPFGGHETGLWQHYVGGDFARRWYERRHGHPPKNVFGTSLFNVSCAAGLRWARSSGAALLGAFPRYHPSWAWWLVRPPILREFLVSNLVLVLRPTTQNAFEMTRIG